MKVNAFLVAKKSAVEEVDDLMKQVMAENKLDEDVGGNNSGITDREIEERLARLKDMDPSMINELVNILVSHTHYKIKMISAQHLSNNGKNWQKLSYQKILLAW